MKILTKEILKENKKILIVNSNDIDKFESFSDPKYNYIFVNKIKNYPNNSYLFSWSEFKNGYEKRCIISKNSFYYTNKILALIKKKYKFFFFFLKLQASQEVVLNSLKKYILNKIYNYFFVYFVIKELKKNKVNFTFINFNQDFIFFEKIIKLFFKEKVAYKDYSKKKFFLPIKKIFTILFYPVYCIIASSGFIFKKKIYKLAIRIYNAGFNFKTSPSIVWPIKNKKNIKNKSLLVCEDALNKNFLEDLREQKIDYIFSTNKNPINLINFYYLFFSSFLFFRNLIFCFFLFKVNYFLLCYIETFFVSFFKWKKFVSVIKLDKYIAYHNYSFDHIIRNYLFKLNNCKTLHYKHSFSENLYGNPKNYNNYIYGYCSYDTEFHWAKCSEDMSLIDKSCSKNFICNGPLANQYKYFVKKKISKKKTITFFTTQLGTQDSVCSFINHEKFLKFILKFSKDKNNFIILKPKYKLKRIRKNYPRIYKIVLELKKVSNIKVIENKSAEYIISFSDFIISMPFASTTVQGIYNHLPSIYLDLYGQFKSNFYKKNNIYFNDENKALKAIKKITYNNSNKQLQVLANVRKKIFNIDFKNTKKISYYTDL